MCVKISIFLLIHSHIPLLQLGIYILSSCTFGMEEYKRKKERTFTSLPSHVLKQNKQPTSEWIEKQSCSYYKNKGNSIYLYRKKTEKLDILLPK